MFEYAELIRIYDCPHDYQTVRSPKDARQRRMVLSWVEREWDKVKEIEPMERFCKRLGITPNFFHHAVGKIGQTYRTKQTAERNRDRMVQDALSALIKRKREQQC